MISYNRIYGTIEAVVEKNRDTKLIVISWAENPTKYSGITVERAWYNNEERMYVQDDARSQEINDLLLRKIGVDFDHLEEAVGETIPFYDGPQAASLEDRSDVSRMNFPELSRPFVSFDGLWNRTKAQGYWVYSSDADYILYPTIGRDRSPVGFIVVEEKARKPGRYVDVNPTQRRTLELLVDTHTEVFGQDNSIGIVIEHPPGLDTDIFDALCVKRYFKGAWEPSTFRQSAGEYLLDLINAMLHNHREKTEEVK